MSLSPTLDVDMFELLEYADVSLIPIETQNQIMDVFFSHEPSMDDMLELEKYMASDKFDDPVHVEAKHAFAEGLYARQVTIPAGTLVVGKRHAKSHFFFLMKGTATIVTDDGIEKVTGPLCWASPVGSKRAVYCHTEATFVNVHASTATNLEDLEQELINPELKEIEA